MWHRRRIVFLVLVFVLWFPSRGIEAQQSATPEASQSAFAIYPKTSPGTPYFQIELDPGQSGEQVAVIGTLDSTPVELRVYAANASNPANGGFVAGNSRDERVEPATWIDLDEQIVNLAGSESIEIPFSIAVPDGTPPGQYVAALVAESAEPVDGGQLLNFLFRSAIAVEILVPGTMKGSFDLGAPQIVSEDDLPTLVIPIRNTGNYRVRPSGDVVVTTANGDIVADAPLALESIYGGNETTIEVLLPNELESGDYIVSGQFSDVDSGQTVEIKEVVVAYTAPGKNVATLAVESESITVVGEPIQFMMLDLTIMNSGQPVPSASIVLTTSRNGEFVEDYPVAQNQAIPQGESALSVRYIPITGWEPGEYEFVITFNSIDASGTESAIATHEIENSLVVP